MEIQLWKEILSPYEQAVDELLLKFKHIIKDYRSQGLYSPIENVTGRVKRISSILDKMQKKHIPMDHIVEEMDDIAGIRIMCQFEEDIYKVVEIIRNRRDMSIREEKDYITNAKTSGYRSFHIILNYDVYTIKGLQTIQAEIQIRTMAMDFWATIEHSLQYKYRHNMPADLLRRHGRLPHHSAPDHGHQARGRHERSHQGQHPAAAHRPRPEGPGPGRQTQRERQFVRRH